MSVGFCGSLNNNFSMSVGFCGTQYCKKKIFVTSVGFCGVLWDSIYTKRNICNVCGVLWDSIYTKKNHLQCLWCSVGLYILKKWSRLLEITFNHVCGVLWCLWCTVGFSHTRNYLFQIFRKCFTVLSSALLHQSPSMILVSLSALKALCVLYCVVA